MWNSKEHIQLNSSFLGDGLARFIGIVYLFYITHILPKRVILLLGLYVIIRFILLVSSFSSELLEGDYFSSFFSSDELNLKAAAFNNSFFSNADFFIINKEALKNSLDANMEMLAGSADDVSSSNEWSANDVSSSNEWSANELILKASSADNGSTLGGNGSSENANSNNNGNANSNNNGNANSNNNELRRARNFLNQVAEIVRFSGGIVMNPDLVFSESDLRHFTDSQISNRTEGLKGMLEDEQKRNDYRYVDHYLEELRKLSNEKRRREEQNSRILQALIDRANEERRR